MELNFKFIGPIKFKVGGKSKITLDVPENCTVAEALGILGLDFNNAAAFGFAAVNGEKVDTEYALQASDDVAIFSRSFGG
jgi:sulfur carrier protein ThiS